MRPGPQRHRVPHSAHRSAVTVAHDTGPYGAGHLVNESVDKTAAQILSFSPCFRLPDDMTPHGDF